MDHLKSLLCLLQYCFCLGFFGWDACRILASRPEIEGAAPALEDSLLTTGLPWKPQFLLS